MKPLLPLVCCLTIFAGCSPDPAPCTASTWKYEVILENPVPSGTFLIIYDDGYCNSIQDTTITSTWTKEVTPFNQSCSTTWQVILYPYTKYIQTGVQNSATLNIYRDGTLTQTTGSPIPIPFDTYINKLDICQ